MILPPISVVASWPAANYDNPVVIGHYLTPVLCLFIAITITTVGFRLYSRARLLKSFKWDDWMIIPATIAAVILSITNIMTLKYGWGKHIWDVPISMFGIARFWSFVAQNMFTTAAALTKISILLFYTRFCTTKKTRWAIWGAMAFVAVWYVAWMVVIWLQCIPIQAYWRYPIPTDYCINYEDGLHVINGATNAFTDCLVWAIPIPTVLKLQLPIRQKLSLLGLFSLGLMAPVAGICRVIYIHKSLYVWDVTWWGYPMWVCTSLEAHVSIVCGSAPALKPLIVRAFPRFGSSADASARQGDIGVVELNNKSGSGSHSNNNTFDRRSSHKKTPRSVYSLTDFGSDSMDRIERQGTFDSTLSSVSEVRRKDDNDGSSIETLLIQDHKGMTGKL